MTRLLPLGLLLSALFLGCAPGTGRGPGVGDAHTVSVHSGPPIRDTAGAADRAAARQDRAAARETLYMRSGPRCSPLTCDPF